MFSIMISRGGTTSSSNSSSNPGSAPCMMPVSISSSFEELQDTNNSHQGHLTLTKPSLPGVETVAVLLALKVGCYRPALLLQTQPVAVSSDSSKETSAAAPEAHACTADCITIGVSAACAAAYSFNLFTNKQHALGKYLPCL